MSDSWLDGPADEYGSADELDDRTFDALDFSGLPDATSSDGAEPDPVLITVTNPPGTISVTVLIDGSTERVELAPRVATDMTESQLAEEILLVARLARQNAQAGQHLLIAGVMQRLGHDPVSTQGHLEHEMGLPSAETALSDKAKTFATRYVDDAN